MLLSLHHKNSAKFQSLNSFQIPQSKVVAKGRCKGVVGFADVTFDFSIAYRSNALTGNHYSEYQLFLYQTISEHREQGMTFDAIAEWLKKEGYLTVRSKRFRGAHFHSIWKKRLANEELLNREYPPVWSDFSMEVVDKTIFHQMISQFILLGQLTCFYKSVENICKDYPKNLLAERFCEQFNSRDGFVYDKSLKINY